MLDPRFVAENPDVVKETLRRRFASEELIASVDVIVTLSELRRDYITEVDSLRGQRNTLSKQIGGLMRDGKQEEAQSIKAQVATGAIRLKELEEKLSLLEEEFSALNMRLPNLLHDDAHEGKTEEDNEVIRTFGTIPEFDFEPQAHVEVGEGLDILDMARAAKMSGARFAVLKGAGARLERALINFYLDLHVSEHGYTELMVPYIVQRSALEGTGQLPKFENDLFKFSEKLNGGDAFLIPTAEVPITNMHAGEILEEAVLPLQYVAFTPCFRAEAGSAGRDVRGILRQHQFHKVEMVWITTPEKAEENHQTLVGHAENCLNALELPFRTVRHCGGEVGFSAHKCYDLEVWLPSQKKYREVSSVSQFTDFQSRRMGMRYRPEPVDGKKQKTRLTHTLNGSGIAIGRTVVAILENNQQADGSVVVPSVLIPYMGGIKVIKNC
jgi:seryl-tRNA synthetase